MKLAAKDFNIRLKRGKKFEDEIAEFLKGKQWEDGGQPGKDNVPFDFGNSLSKQEDIKGMDRKRIIDPPETWQFKSRDGQPDILFDRYEPYYGLNDLKTRNARCYEKEMATCAYFAFRVFPDSEKPNDFIIKIVTVEDLRKVILKLDEEFKRRTDIQMSRRQQYAQSFFQYETDYANTCFQYMFDPASGTPKLIYFLSDKAFENPIINGKIWRFAGSLE